MYGIGAVGREAIRKTIWGIRGTKVADLQRIWIEANWNEEERERIDAALLVRPMDNQIRMLQLILSSQTILPKLIDARDGVADIGSAATGDEAASSTRIFGDQLGEKIARNGELCRGLLDLVSSEEGEEFDQSIDMH